MVYFSVCAEKTYVLCDEAIWAMAFLVPCFPVAFRMSLLMCVGSVEGVKMGLDPTYLLLLGFARFGDS